MFPLTSYNHSEFEPVSFDKLVEHFNKEMAEVEPLQGHPTESGQQGAATAKSLVKTNQIGGQCCHRVRVITKMMLMFTEIPFLPVLSEWAEAVFGK